MEVRLMQEADLEQVAEIEKASFSKPWSYRAFKEVLDMPNYIYVVGVANKEVLGYGGVYCVLNEANITNVAVKRKYAIEELDMEFSKVINGRSEESRYGFHYIRGAGK